VPEIELSDAIKQLRSALNASVDDAANERIQFELGTVELTLSVAITKEASPTAKVRIYIVEAGAGGKFSSSSTQQLKLTLRPVDMHAAADSNGERPSPFIRGTSLPDER
jgi:hypothetical protein